MRIAGESDGASHLCFGKEAIMKYKKKLLITLLAMTVTALSLKAAVTAAPADDELVKSWAKRASTAKKRLAAPGLDACDMAVERAFQRVKESTTGKFRSFGLQVDISGKVLTASYSYRDGRLVSFELITLPGRWIARQRAESKTLSILVPDANCAFDLCTSDPFAAGPCPGDTPE